MFFKESIQELISNKDKREEWVNTSGLLVNLTDNQKQKLFELFNDVLNNWEEFKKYEIIYEFIPPMLRQAISYLDIDANMPYSVKSNKKKTFVYLWKFNLNNYLNHFNELYTSSSTSFSKIFLNIDIEAELCHLCIRDYFYKLAKESKVEDYESIIRDNKINEII